MEELDRTLTLAINSLHCPASDAFWSTLSGKYCTAIVYLIIIGIMFWRLGWKKALLMLVTTALILGLEDQVCNLIKDTVCRLRPGNDPVMLAKGLYLPIAPSTTHIYGFPSAHAANAFAFLACAGIFLAEERRKHHEPLSRTWKTTISVLSIWAVLISLSRVFLAKHFVGDILFGAILGAALATAGSYLAIYLYGHFSRKKSRS